MLWPQITQTRNKAQQHQAPFLLPALLSDFKTQKKQ